MDHFLGITIPVIFIAISGHIIWKSTDAFEIASDFLGRKMSRGVKGATLNAIASSMPEFLATMFFLFYIKDKGVFEDSFSGGLGVVAGSAVFNILIIPFAILLFGMDRKNNSLFKLDKSLIRRDGIFLLVSNIVFIIIISQEVLSYKHGLCLIIVYIIYLGLLRKGLGINREAKHDDINYEVKKVVLNLRHFVFLDLKLIILNGKKLNPLNAWLTLLTSTLLMSIGTWMLVLGTKLLGSDQYTIFGNIELKGLDLPIVFISVLLASAATSIPDTMISIRDAKKGKNDDSISNAIGSNIFDLSFAIGLPLLTYTLINGPIEMSKDIRILSISYWIFMWVINLIVISFFIISSRITKLTGYFLLFLYILFILYVVEETSGMILIRMKVESLINLVN